MFLGVVIVQSLFSRFPCKIVFPCSNISNLFFVKIKLHPASHNCPIDNNDPDESFGNRCTIFASIGNCLMSSSPTCVDCMVA